jgi:mannosyl-oligosaccharide alpha-1,2-mannosidase
LDEGSLANTSRADQVRDAIRHLWSGYRQRAWGSDEVKPISGKPGTSGLWGDVGMNVLDTLDTLWLAGLHKEFAEGEQWVTSLKFDDERKSGDRISFFETTIRALGGLLSSYALSGHQIFLDKASELGRRLQHAFPERGQEILHLWPAAYLNIRKPDDFEVAAGWLQKNILADAGSNILEFDYLAEATGDDSLRAGADANEARLLGLAKEKDRHLASRFMEVENFQYGSNGEETVGAYADSYFEYLLKGYIQSGGTERQLLEEWKQAMQEMRDTLVRKSKGGLTYVAQARYSTVMDHLSCFMGGLLALGSHYVAKEDAEDWWLPLGQEITRSCYEMYRQSPSGLAPDISAFEATVEPIETENRIRPETLESLFYLYRVTGNETYRQWSWDIFEAINKHTRTEFGFANAKDVTCVPVPLDDREETFVGAETLKYALLIHLPESTLPLDRFVLNTEAHPLPIQRGLTKARIDASEGIVQAHAIERGKY